MINIKHYNNLQTFQKDVDRHHNMIIIGPGSTEYNLNQIAYYSSPDVVEQLYGISELSDAFKLAKDFGVPDVFVANIQTKTDYIEFVDILKHYDFTYIVPIGINFSDTFYNPLLNREMTYTELYLDNIGDYSDSTIVMTDHHASLYEDMDSFLDEMAEKIEQFNNIAYKARRNGRNLCLVANNLEDYEYSNVLLATALCVSAYSEYPQINFGPAIFDIDSSDVGGELIYFKNNYLAATSVENLKNFRIENDAAKIITIDEVIKFIERELDFSDFKGKVFTEYVRLRLYNRLSEFLKQIVSTVIRSYTIKSVDFVVTEPGAGQIVNTFSLTPINSVEEFDVMMEV
jgi:hypothetical protein